MITQKNLYLLQDAVFAIVINISYILIFISAIGLSQSAPKYLDYLDYYVRIYICLFLLWRFNPIIPLKKFTDLDRKIAFSAGLFILTTTVLNNYLVDAENKLKQFFIKN